MSGSRALSLMPRRKLSSRGRYCLFWRPDERFLRQADRQVGPAASKAPRMRPPPWPYLSVAWLYRNRRGDHWPLVLTGIPLFERSQARSTRKTRPEAPKVSLQFLRCRRFGNYNDDVFAEAVDLAQAGAILRSCGAFNTDRCQAAVLIHIMAVQAQPIVTD